MSAYQVPPGGLTTVAAARRLLSPGLSGMSCCRRRMRFYSRANPIYKTRELRWLGQDGSAPPDVGLPPFIANAPVAPFGLDQPAPPQIGPSQVSTVDVNPIDTLISPQQQAATAPYTNVMSQIANALANPTGAQQAQRTILTPTPASGFSAALASLPSWALPAVLIVGGLALVGGARKGRR